jgi:hypothetical protein
MNNPAGLDTNSYLISKCSTIELVTPPIRTEGCWLIDPEVGTIQSDLADRAIVIMQAIIPIDLFSVK